MKYAEQFPLGLYTGEGFALTLHFLGVKANAAEAGSPWDELSYISELTHAADRQLSLSLRDNWENRVVLLHGAADNGKVEKIRAAAAGVKSELAALARGALAGSVPWPKFDPAREDVECYAAFMENGDRSSPVFRRVVGRQPDPVEMELLAEIDKAAQDANRRRGEELSSAARTYSATCALAAKRPTLGRIYRTDQRYRSICAKINARWKAELRRLTLERKRILESIGV